MSLLSTYCVSDIKRLIRDSAGMAHSGPDLRSLESEEETINK